jgi:hypothetical protein
MDPATMRQRADQDVAVERLAQRVLRSGAITSTGLLAGRLKERRRVAKVTTLLADAPLH